MKISCLSKRVKVEQDENNCYIYKSPLINTEVTAILSVVDMETDHSPQCNYNKHFTNDTKVQHDQCVYL